MESTKTLKKQLFLSGSDLTSVDVFHAVHSNIKLAITDTTEYQIRASHQLLNKFIEDNRIIYGVNTSLGGLLTGLSLRNILKSFKKI